jgi:anionic cell wall polymer biosynthesis LytR-Cps2A-Psr (LCP) family protein
MKQKILTYLHTIFPKLFPTKKRLYLGLFAVSMIVSSTIATIVYYSSKPNINSSEYADVTVVSDVFDPGETIAIDTDITEKNVISILLLGYGGAGHQGGYLSDVIQIIQFNFETKKIAFISIPRDLFVSLPNGQTGKINGAFSMGNSKDPIHSGAQVAKQMATTVTGIPIDAFISVDFNGFKRAIGGPFGGLEVTVSETLDDKWYPIKGEEQNTCGMSPEKVAELTNTYSGFALESKFECRYEHIYYPPGVHHMEGGDALAYVRSRHGSAGGDFSRSKRQQELLLAIRDKLFSLEALENVPRFFKELIAHTDTDLTTDIILALVPKLATTEDMDHVGVTLSTANVLSSTKSSAGAYIIVPNAGQNNWGETQQYIQSEITK